MNILSRTLVILLLTSSAAYADDFLGAGGGGDIGGSGTANEVAFFNPDGTTLDSSPSLTFNDTLLTLDTGTSFTINGILDVASSIVLNAITYLFPAVDGSDNQVLTTDGSGLLTWEDDDAGGGSALATDVDGVEQSADTTQYDWLSTDFILTEPSADQFTLTLNHHATSFVSAVFNPAHGATGDFRIATIDSTHAFFLDYDDGHLHIGGTAGIDTLNIQGDVNIVHVSEEPDDHAFEIDVNGSGFGDNKAIDIVYVPGAISAGEDDEVIGINIDQIGAGTGSDITGVGVLATDGSAMINGLGVGVLVNPVIQLSGVFSDMDSALANAVDVQGSFILQGSDPVTIFAADDDTVTIGNASKFEEIEWILSTFASGSGIKPTFEFSTGVGPTYGDFEPIDGTNGMRNNGVFEWLDSDIPTWAVDGNSEFLIRVTRTQNNINTVPIVDFSQIAVATQYLWDAGGTITFAQGLIANDLEVEGGNIGLASAKKLVHMQTSSFTVHGDIESKGTISARAYDRSGMKFSKTVTFQAAEVHTYTSIWRVPEPVTVSNIRGKLNVAGSTGFGLFELDTGSSTYAGWSDGGLDSGTTITAGMSEVNDDGSLSNPGLDAGDWVGIAVLEVDGTNDLSITWEGTYD